MVLQDTHLFTGTIADNIRYGKQDATDEDVYEASRLSGAEEFIKLLPDGFNTRITENGENLSGGQKQRTAIARMLTQKTPIMVFDDSLSAVDADGKLVVTTVTAPVRNGSQVG